MGACFTEDMIPAEKITATIDKFFKEMAIRKIGIEDIKGKLKSRIFSSKVVDIEGWKEFLNEELINSEFANTSKMVANSAMEDAKNNYNDQTLPFTTLLFYQIQK